MNNKFLNIGISFDIGKYKNGNIDWILKDIRNFIMPNALTKLYTIPFCDLTKYVLIGYSDNNPMTRINIQFDGTDTISSTDYTFTGDDIGKYIIINNNIIFAIINIIGQSAIVSHTINPGAYSGIGYLYVTLSTTLVDPMAISGTYDNSPNANTNKKVYNSLTNILTIENTRSVLFSEVETLTEIKEIGWSDINSGGTSSELIGRKTTNVIFEPGDIPYIRVSLIRTVDCSIISNITNIISGLGGNTTTSLLRCDEFNNNFYSYIGEDGNTIIPSVRDTLLEGYNDTQYKCNIVVGNIDKDITIDNPYINDITLLDTIDANEITTCMTAIADNIFAVCGYGHDEHGFVRIYDTSTDNITLINETYIDLDILTKCKALYTNASTGYTYLFAQTFDAIYRFTIDLSTYTIINTNSILFDDNLVEFSIDDTNCICLLSNGDIVIVNVSNMNISCIYNITTHEEIESNAICVTKGYVDNDFVVCTDNNEIRYYTYIDNTISLVDIIDLSSESIGLIQSIDKINDLPIYVANTTSDIVLVKLESDTLSITDVINESFQRFQILNYPNGLYDKYNGRYFDINTVTNTFEEQPALLKDKMICFTEDDKCLVIGGINGLYVYLYSIKRPHLLMRPLTESVPSIKTISSIDFTNTNVTELNTIAIVPRSNNNQYSNMVMWVMKLNESVILDSNSLSNLIFNNNWVRG